MRQQAAERRDHDREKQTQQNGNGDTAPHAPFVLRAEAVAQADAEAAGDPLNEAEDQIDDDGGGPHRGQRVRTQRPSYDHRVRKSIEKLEQIPADHRQGKQEQGGKRLPLSQIFCHRNLHFGTPAWRSLFLCVSFLSKNNSMYPSTMRPVFQERRGDLYADFSFPVWSVELLLTMHF